MADLIVFVMADLIAFVMADLIGHLSDRFPVKPLIPGQAGNDG